MTSSSFFSSTFCSYTTGLGGAGATLKLGGMTLGGANPGGPTRIGGGANIVLAMGFTSSSSSSCLLWSILGGLKVSGGNWA